QNLTMQRRSLPLAQLVTVGNGAVTGVLDLIEAMLEDSRITAIGLHLEEMPDVAGLSRVAIDALRRRVPIVVLKSGSSDLGSRVTLSHTSSLAGSDVLCDALFRRLGIARVHRIEAFVETLKFLHTNGPLPGTRVASASCSGGEAAHVADLAHRRGISLPDFTAATASRLRAVLGDRVCVRNPLDYHTYIWGEQEALTECFSAFLGSGSDCHLLVLDFPRADRCSSDEFEITVRAFMAAHSATGSRACVVSSLPEGLPEEIGRRLVAVGIAPMQGVADCLAAISAAQQVGAAQIGVSEILPLAAVAVARRQDGPVEQLDEAEAKRALAAFGVPVPSGAVAARREVGRLAAQVGFPVVVKAVSPTLTHKSEAGGVRIGLMSENEVELAADAMSELSDRFLVERMVDGALVELIVGVHRDFQFGLTMTIGAGGVLVELIKDTVTLLLPATAADIRNALSLLRIWPLLDGFRGRSADVDSVIDAVSSIIDYVRQHADRLLELEVNPLLVLPDRVVAADALIRLSTADTRNSSAPCSVDLQDVG
ncbi:MAG: acetate--CoA ligase family protein, partial [Actinomycetota bacterium]|nr:acetate--CoA ligase family protein [Actinomycetota bacterium]